MATGTEGMDVGAVVRRAHPATLLLIAAGAVSAAVLLTLGSRLTFLLDDWEVLVYRRGFNADAILIPHGENIVVGPVLVYKALIAVFGTASAFPFRVVAVATFAASAAVLYAYLRSRLGEWVALAGAVAILFFGAAWEDLLWPFQIGYFVSMGAGLGALLALDRGSRRGDRTACALLLLSALFSSLGLPFIAAAAVAVICGPPGGRARRAYAVAVPAAVFALWWLGWGHEAKSAVTAENVATAPLFLIDGVASSISSLLGLATPRDEVAVGALDWGRPLLVAAVAVGLWRLWRLRRIPDWVIVAAVLSATFWLLAGVNETSGREPTASRYQYVGAIFLLLLAAELYRGGRIGRRGIATVFGITVLAVASNVSYLHQAYESYKGTSEIERADLAAVEIARDTVEPGFLLSEKVAQTAYVHVEAGPYLSAADAHGSPAFSEAELAAAPEPARAAADTVLAAALGLRVEPGDEVSTGDCETVPPAPAGEPAVVDLAPGGAAVEAAPGATATLQLRRFATEFGIGAGELQPGAAEVIAIPTDRSTRPWQLQVQSASPVRVCRLAS